MAALAADASDPWTRESNLRRRPTYWSLLPTSTSLEEMVEAFGARWTVEQCFEEAKGEVGLDEYARPLLAGMVSSRDTLPICSGLFNGLAI